MTVDNSAERNPDATVRRRAEEVRGARISWLEAGEGTPLVLLHGIGSIAESWTPVLPLLAKTYRVIAWDMPGYGESAPLAESQPTAGLYASVLAGLLDLLHVSSAHVLGHSLGALIAAELAYRRPESVQSIILVSPALGSGLVVGADLPAAIAERITDLAALGAPAFAQKRAEKLCSPKASPDAVAAVERAMARMTHPGYDQACWLLAQGDLTRTVRQINVSGAVIGASDDRVVPPEKARTLAMEWPGARYHEMANVGHASYVEDPAAYTALVHAVIENHRRRS